MTNAAKPRSTISGDCHHRSVRNVRCGIWARLGEKTPVALRSAGGALTVPSRWWWCGTSVAGLAGDAPVVDFAPEGGVVLGVRDRDLLPDVVVVGRPSGDLELFCVDV